MKDLRATVTKLFLRQFTRKVAEHTEEARDKFQRAPICLDRDHLPRAYWIGPIVEELGKLARVCNKLDIATDPSVRRRWNEGGRHRMVTLVSLTTRLAEAWDRLPAGHGVDLGPQDHEAGQ